MGLTIKDSAGGAWALSTIVGGGYRAVEKVVPTGEYSWSIEGATLAEIESEIEAVVQQRAREKADAEARAQAAREREQQTRPRTSPRPWKRWTHGNKPRVILDSMGCIVTAVDSGTGSDAMFVRDCDNSELIVQAVNAYAYDGAGATDAELRDNLRRLVRDLFDCHGGLSARGHLYDRARELGVWP